MTVEEALVEEVDAHLATVKRAKPRRSGYDERVVGTQYGQIGALRVPKLRSANR